MWQQLTPADIARVKHQLSLTRAEILSRHAAELKALDTQQEEIENLEALLAEFAEKCRDCNRRVPLVALGRTRFGKLFP